MDVALEDDKARKCRNGNSEHWIHPVRMHWKQFTKGAIILRSNCTKWRLLLIIEANIDDQILIAGYRPLQKANGDLQIEAHTRNINTIVFDLNQYSEKGCYCKFHFIPSFAILFVWFVSLLALFCRKLVLRTGQLLFHMHFVLFLI